MALCWFLLVGDQRTSVLAPDWKDKPGGRAKSLWGGDFGPCLDLNAWQVLFDSASAATLRTGGASQSKLDGSDKIERDAGGSGPGNEGRGRRGEGIAAELTCSCQGICCRLKSLPAAFAAWYVCTLDMCATLNTHS